MELDTLILLVQRIEVSWHAELRKLSVEKGVLSVDIHWDGLVEGRSMGRLLHHLYLIHRGW